MSVKWRRIRRKRYPSAHGRWEAVPRVGRCKADRLIAGPRDSRSRDRSGIAAVHEEGGLTFVLPEAGQGAVGHVAGRAVVFGFFQKDNAEGGTAAEQRLGLSWDVPPACAPAPGPRAPHAPVLFFFF